MKFLPLPIFSNKCAALVAGACLVMPLSGGEGPGAGTYNPRVQDQRRIDMEEAEELLLQGDQAYNAGRFEEAAAAFKGARALVTDAPATRELRSAATARFAMASIERARELSRKGDLQAARATLDEVLAPGVAPDHRDALAVRAQLDDPIRTNPAATVEHVANVDEVRRLLYTAEGAFDLGRFDDARRHYESVLRIDPTNTAARRGMERVTREITAYAAGSKDQGRAEMLAQIDSSWETPVAPALEVPELSDMFQESASRANMPVLNKIERIILPEVMLDEATIEEAVDLLRQRSQELDVFEPDPALRGVNFNVEIGGSDSELGNSIRAHRIKLRARGLPISEVLNQIAAQTQTVWSTDAFAVVIRPRGAEAGQMLTRVFRVPPNFKAALNSQAGGEAGAAAADPFAPQAAPGLQVVRLDVREALTNLGMQFPEGSSVSLTGNSLAVTNTPGNIAFAEAVVDSIAKQERVMAKIVVKMMRVEENRLKEIGFDWLLDTQGFGGASWIPGADKLNISGGTQGNGGNLGDMANGAGGVDPRPITAGNRSGNAATFNDSIDSAINRPRYGIGSLLGAQRAPGAFQVTKVLDDGIVSAMLRAVDQKKGVDLVTTASTIVHSGQVSTVRSVREMMYPQSYEPPELPNSVGDVDGFGGGGGGNMNAVTPSHPTDFTSREVGVILEVTPTVDLDNGCVDVALVPQVINFDGFIDWGSPIRQPLEVPLTGLLNPLASSSAELSANHIYMPVFSRHSTNTSVYVADGATIVIGGMLQDRINMIDDKTPVLGAIPLLGRLFQSQVNQPVSTAVVFFVNVSMVDPTGQPFRQR